MGRQEKRSRMRLLPPKIQLQQRDALTGSYPTNSRFSIDGRTGNYSTNFDDTKTVSFTESNEYIPGIGFTEDSIWLNNSASNDLSASIVTAGSIRSQTIEGLPFFHFSPGQELTPFRDNDQPAVDGKSSNNPFFATGSAVADVGEGFNSPLWSKNKIEIDISVASNCRLEVNLLSPAGSAGTGSYLMGYYNCENKKWEGIGHGANVTDQVFRSGSKDYNEVPICYGFSPSALIPWRSEGAELDSGYRLLDRGGLPFRDFGFPFDARYHATSSQTLKMSNYIDRPFLLEKIVIEISASFQSYFNFWPDRYPATLTNIYPTRTNALDSTATANPSLEWIPSHINTFFILNQRKNVLTNTYAAGCVYNDGIATYPGLSKIPDSVDLTGDGNLTYVNTGRDLISFMNVACINTALNSNGFGNQINKQDWYLDVDNLFGDNVNLKIFDDNIDYGLGSPGLVGCFGEAAGRPPFKIRMSGSVKSPRYFSPGQKIGSGYSDILLSFLKQPRPIGTGPVLLTNSINPFPFQYGSNIPSNLTAYSTGGRTGLGMQQLSSRDYITSLQTVNYNKVKQFGTSPPASSQLVHPNYSVKYFDSTLYTNPYILFPTDELILGWQLPALMGSVEDGADSFLGRYYIEFKTGDSKVTLYGSYIREGREYNDGLNQLLSSDGIHEVIE